MSHVTRFVVLAVLVACGSTSGPTQPDAVDRSIKSITITPGTVAMKRGLDAPKALVAMGTLADGTSLDVTDVVDWSSSSPTIASVNDGVVKALLSGTSTITATSGAVSGSAALTVTSPILVATEDSAPIGLVFFDGYQSGNAAPTRVIAGGTTTFTLPWKPIVHGNELFVSDTNASVSVFPLDASGDVAPTRRIAGATTQMTSTSTYGMAISGDEIFVGASGKILVFPINGTGDIAPTRVITGASTLLTSTNSGLFIDHDEIYVATGTGSTVLVFPKTANGDVAPTRTISGSHTTMAITYDVYVRDDEVFVGTAIGVRVFSRDANGDVAPLRSISGADTMVPTAIGLGSLDHDLYVQTIGNGMQVHNIESTSDAAPLRAINGAMTTLANPRQFTFY